MTKRALTKRSKPTKRSRGSKGMSQKNPKHPKTLTASTRPEPPEKRKRSKKAKPAKKATTVRKARASKDPETTESKHLAPKTRALDRRPPAISSEEVNGMIAAAFAAPPVPSILDGMDRSYLDVEEMSAEQRQQLLALADSVTMVEQPIRPLAPVMVGVIRRSYRIEKWPSWDHELHGFVHDFRATLGISPNILLASEVTHARIDLVAKKANLVNPKGEHPEPAEYAALSGFAGPDYHLDFFVDQKLADRAVSLIYDSDPTGGGEPVPDEDTAVPGAPSVTVGKLGTR